MIHMALLGLLGVVLQAAGQSAFDNETPILTDTVVVPTEVQPVLKPEAAPIEASSWLLAQPPAPSQETLALHREWRTRRLELRSETISRPSGAWYRHPHRSRYWYQYNGGVEYKVQAWGVYQGFERMNVPDFLAVVGEDDLRESLSLDIRHNRRWATTGFGLAATGAGVMLAGVFAANAAQSPEEWVAASNLTGAGALTTIIGIFGGSVAGARAHALERYPKTIMPSSEAIRRVRVYNADLRDELSLVPLSD